MLQTEAQFQRKVKNRLDNVEGLYYFVKEAKSIRGIPDIIGCYRGHFFAMEVKRSKAEAMKKTGRIVLQKFTLSKINLAYGLAYIIYPENFDEVFEELEKRCSTYSFS